MRRLVTLAITATFVMAFTAVPAGGQLDVPDLGFEITPVEGFPGQAIEGTVDLDDVNAFCQTDLVEVDDELLPEWTQIFAENYATWADAFEDAYLGEFPDLADQETPLGSAWLALGTLLSAAIGAGADDLAAFESSFAMVMADITTLEPLVVETGAFGPDDGDAGPLVTPFDVAPGIYAIAAVCNNIAAEPDAEGLETMLAGTFALADAIEEFVDEDPANCPDPPGLPGCLLAGDPPPVQALLPPVAEDVLPELFAPTAAGFDLYCVLDEDGECNGEVPADPLDPAAPAEPVGTDPTFTG